MTRTENSLSTGNAREAALRDVLRVISASRSDEQPVFEAILGNAARLCDAPTAGLHMVNEARTHTRLVCGWGLDHGSFPIGEEFVLGAGMAVTAAIQEARVVHVSDLTTSPAYLAGNPIRVRMVEKEGMRVFLVVPLLRDGIAFGCINLSRQKTQPFSEADIALVETFAEQAVIAIENVRQFRELQEQLEREEATREVLQVISQSRDDEEPVFRAIMARAERLCHAQGSGLQLLNEAGTHLVQSESRGEDHGAFPLGTGFDLSSPAGQCVAVREKRIVHIEDLKDTDLYRDGHEGRRDLVDIEGIRTHLHVPLMRKDVAFGNISLSRKEPKPFTPDQIALVETFAEQAVIAIENARQFKALEALNAELGDRVSEQVDELERMGRLKRFLSPQVADAVVSSGDDNLLGSHRALIAILFCDIRGFTAFCESAEPEETIEVLQTFHETLGKLIHDAGAGFDHRAGDGIMVVFNDPIPCDHPAGEAVRVALKMRDSMDELCANWRKLGHRLGFGVGISMGYATVGMVGFEGRYDYTASGTAVNLASRLCDHAGDREILISARVAMAVKDVAGVEAAGSLTLKGFHAPVDVCRITEVKELQ